MKLRPLAVLCVLAALSAASAGAKEREKNVIADFEAGKTEDRIRLAPALGRMKDKKAVDALLTAFDIRRASPRESAAVIAALGRAGDARAVEELAGADDYLRSMALQMGDLPAQLQVVRGAILEALGHLGGDQAVSILEESVNDKDPRVVEEAVRGLGRLQIKDAIPALQQLAARGEMTQTVFEALASIGDKRASSTLEQGLSSPDKFVNVEAAYALAALGRKEMIPRLEGCLKNDPGSEKVGILAGYYLAKLDRTTGLDHLVALTKKPDSGFAVLAAEALGKSGNPRAVLPLVEALKTDDSSLRLAIARGLGSLGGTRALAALKKLRQDPNPGVHNAALISLAELGEIEDD
ncbi:MAG TPA: HEAT repeat domain-containing protein [Elusimicrobiota bacterium]|nr:HEAT repeat domain-containing protein [Elusimicrobiota bacterium]